jgi:lambda repressor-like predicted transcriptional regulator
MRADIIIAYIMIKTGLTVPQLAEREKISKQSLYSAINGLRIPRPMAIIAEAIGKPVSEIWPDAETLAEAAKSASTTR